MKSTSTFLPALLLLAACGGMQETVQVRDDVYDIPDRTAMASLGSVPTQPAAPADDDYYDPGQAKQYEEEESYYNEVYNEPEWYNQTRFGFGYSSLGPGYSTFMRYGWNNGCYCSPTGMYDPYWNNSWTSGYGYYGNPCTSNYGYYNPWNNYYGYPGYYYDPFAYGSPYYGGYYPGAGPGYNVPIVAHRPSMTGGAPVTGGSGGDGGTPRMSRPSNVSLLRPGTLVERQEMEKSRSGRVKISERDALGGSGSFERQGEKKRSDGWKRADGGDRTKNTKTSGEDRGRRTSDNSGSDTILGGDGSRGGGGGGGGGSSSPATSPRPRR